MPQPKAESKSTEIGNDRCRQALLQFVETVDATGGVVRDEGGCYAPVADLEWIDLGEAYTEACAVLGRDLVLAEDRLEKEESADDAES